MFPGPSCVAWCGSACELGAGRGDGAGGGAGGGFCTAAGFGGEGFGALGIGFACGQPGKPRSSRQKRAAAISTR